jgi:hypothetical protein
VPHLLRHGTSVFKVISERPVILPSECRALGEGAITTRLTTTLYNESDDFDFAILNFSFLCSTVIYHFQLLIVCIYPS